MGGGRINCRGVHPKYDALKILFFVTNYIFENAIKASKIKSTHPLVVIKKSLVTLFIYVTC